MRRLILFAAAIALSAAALAEEPTFTVRQDLDGNTLVYYLYLVEPTLPECRGSKDALALLAYMEYPDGSEQVVGSGCWFNNGTSITVLGRNTVHQLWRDELPSGAVSDYKKKDPPPAPPQPAGVYDMTIDELVDKMVDRAYVVEKLCQEHDKLDGPCIEETNLTEWLYSLGLTKSNRGRWLYPTE